MHLGSFTVFFLLLLVLSSASRTFAAEIPLVSPTNSFHYEDQYGGRTPDLFRLQRSRPLFNLKTVSVVVEILKPIAEGQPQGWDRDACRKTREEVMRLLVAAGLHPVDYSPDLDETVPYLQICGLSYVKPDGSLNISTRVSLREVVCFHRDKQITVKMMVWERERKRDSVVLGMQSSMIAASLSDFIDDLNFANTIGARHFEKVASPQPK